MLVKLTVSVDKTVADKIRKISKQHKTSISAIISNYITTLPESVSPIQEIPPVTKKILEMSAKLPSVPKDWNYRDELIDAIQERVVFVPDHGGHLVNENCGTHGFDIPEDMLVSHYYSLRKAQKDA